jgi:4-hydroxybenzoate polyprenyltransferase
MTDSPQAPEGQVADAVTQNWVDHRAPAWTRPYLRLSRADRPIGTWLLYIPCIWGVLLAGLRDAPVWHDLWLVAACGAGAWLMRGAGCTWNDITDRDYDARVARTRSRPIPSGQVTVRQAATWMVIQALVAFALLLTFHPVAIWLGVASLGLVAIYPFAKRFTWWPQVFLGLAFNWGALLGWTAHNGQLSWAAMLLYLSGIAWTLFYDTIYAHQDREDDALIGVKSTARLFGEHTHTWLTGFAIAAPLLMVAAILSAGAQDTALWLALAACLAFAGHLAWQLRRLEIDNPDTCLMLFRANRDAGLLPALFLAVALFL